MLNEKLNLFYKISNLLIFIVLVLLISLITVDIFNTNSEIIKSKKKLNYINELNVNIKDKDNKLKNINQKNGQLEKLKQNSNELDTRINKIKQEIANYTQKNINLKNSISVYE